MEDRKIQKHSPVLGADLKSLAGLTLVVMLLGCTVTQQREVLSNPGHEKECVILLHGLIRKPRSMGKMERALAEAGYFTVNIGYPSRQATIEVLTSEAIPPAIEACRESANTRISFVTHSMGGIMFRYFIEHNELPELGRIIMLSPPNEGSEVVDKLRHMPGFDFVNGPAGRQLGTGEDSFPKQLGSANYEVGIITGEANGMFSFLLPGEDDGKVSVASAMLDGMTDFLVVDVGHTFMMTNTQVIRQTIHFLEHGQFDWQPE